MAEQIKPPEVGLRFLWASVSPDPHTVTMRNNLEPDHVTIVVFVPITDAYLVNAKELLVAREAVIKASLVPELDKASDEPEPLLSVEGMRYVFSQLSMSEETEDSEDDDWDKDESSEEESTDEDEDWEDLEDKNDGDFEDDDEGWEDE